MAIKHASAPKAYFNITGLGFAKLTKEGAELKYSDITKTRGLQKIGVETGGELKTAYADGGPIESGNTDGEGEALFPLIDNKKSVRKYIFDSANMTNHGGDGEKGEEAFLKKILGEEYTGNVTEDTETL